MRVDCFLDTNILVYAASANPPERRKKAKAIELLVSPFGVSTQVIQEFYVACTRKPDKPLSPLEVLRWIESLEQQPCVIVDPPLIRSAIAISQHHRVNYWDGAILAAAERLGTEVVYSEDLNHGQSYGSIRVINPFL